jgi:hypothetical protein
LRLGGAIGRAFGDSSRFVVVVWGTNRSKFATAPERTYDDKTIAVTGRVVEFRVLLRIEANTPSPIERSNPLGVGLTLAASRTRANERRCDAVVPRAEQCPQRQ